jgi:serine/threonine protein kinase
MGSEKDGMEIDIWAVGAIFAEMLLGSPIFYGFDPANQLFSMFKVLGFPSRSQISYLGSGYDQLVLPKGHMPATLRDKLPCLCDDGYDLLVRLLDWFEFSWNLFYIHSSCVRKRRNWPCV